MKVPIPRSDALLDLLKEALTPNRLPLLIAIDGADCVGKSSLASRLALAAWNARYSTDLYLTCLDVRCGRGRSIFTTICSQNLS
jgi:hypothetical protein